MPSTKHRMVCGDGRDLAFIPDKSVGLVLTSPPYWTLKEYHSHDSQLGSVEDYDAFLGELNRVWTHALRILIPGGRLIIVVGDVLQSRKAHGRHRCIPLHANIQVACEKIGFDNLAPIFWYKISNVSTEMSRPSVFLGKPYEPNAIIKHDVEYILMCRKPGGYRSPTTEQRAKSKIAKDDFSLWFRQIWDDIPGQRRVGHPAPYPEELAYRLIRMFSFFGDTVVDPFCGTGTTILAAMRAERSSIGVEIDPEYHKNAVRRVRKSDYKPSKSRRSTPANARFSRRIIAAPESAAASAPRKQQKGAEEIIPDGAATGSEKKDRARTVGSLDSGRPYKARRTE